MRYEVVYPFQAGGKRFTAEDAGKVRELPKATRDRYVRQGNLREIPPETQPEPEPAAAAAPRKRAVTVKKTARSKAPPADAPPSTNQGSGDAPADKE